ncbi:Histone-lysine N-methyltransferase NSD3 [Tulasnella sp. 419]|nr:Histone-lysine N-methyltransferase NSD3 [Tulasnella sp. 419]
MAVFDLDDQFSSRSKTFSQLCALPSVKTHDNDESDSSSESSGGVLIIGPRKKLKKKKFPDDFMDRRTLQFEYIKPCNHPGESVYVTKNALEGTAVVIVHAEEPLKDPCARPPHVDASSITGSVIQRFALLADTTGDDRCCNSNYSKGNFKLLRVVSKTYPWGPGWGVEAAEEIKKHEFISEYVGEIVSAPEVGHRFPQDKWINRVYNFTLDSTRTIDSARAGNETRFINHDDGEKVNCAARAISVNGDVRVGFYASKDIQIGEELFFNYGPGFFSEAE